ncbi:MAG: hypothetical protein CO162_03810 [bacterium (Candidatus Ratteibacteria) CG_4_9_14_3_um_filter_41_21]|uniref:Nucleotidyl transferase AbiEii/AbiGii toxin family protein n=2 Tax=Candidatus Ratteibacteria TaxID=2979319 RepID=A0A2M7YG13_9BACT|nr:MAG: hypothetical protein CO162_03810 [bacterium (Candidatus Ratteibacteria) CG_4_9_14_3_um_filter_41_21]
MRDYVLELANKQTGFNAKLNMMREYLQAYILRILHDEGVFRTTAFLGGTALRFIYGLPRFSEDLDFSLSNGEKYSFVKLIKKMKEELRLAGYEVTISYNEKKIVQHAFFQFEGLTYEAGISSHPQQKISIKIEIDTNPPKGAVLRTHIFNKYFPIAFLSYDLSSLFAGKVSALLSRKYTKGRDFFDLGWYLSHWKDISPNIVLLQNALKQVKWKEKIPTETNWRNYLYRVVKEADWRKVRKDIENFLENPSDVNIFTQENVLNLIK